VILITVLLGCDAASLSIWLTTFQDTSGVTRSTKNCIFVTIEDETTTLTKLREQTTQWSSVASQRDWCLRLTSCLQEIKFNVHGSVHSKNVLIYIQQDATLHNLFYLETALHVSGGTTTHHQERKQQYLQHLVFIRPLLLPAAIVAGSSNGVTNTRC
jgi:hypothetical protein